MKYKNVRLWIALIALNLMNFTQMVEAATIIPATSPLANAATNVVRPNIMYTLDDSGSMNQDYTPDYLDDTTSGSGSGMCWGVDITAASPTILDTNQAAKCVDSSSSMVNIGTGSDTTTTTSGITIITGSGNDIPAATPELNYQHYNPTIYYQPPVKANGVSYGNMSTTVARVNGFSTGTSGALNLTTTGWIHKVWCDLPGATATDTTHCKENANSSSDNLFPQFVGTTAYVFPKTYGSTPFYYEMGPSEFCSNAAMTSCIRATSASGAYTLPSNNRWCASYNTLTNAYSNCQGRRDATHFIPNYLGYVNDQSYGTITVTDATIGKQISQITIGATNLLSGTPTADTTATGAINTTAKGICTAIKNGPQAANYYVRSGSTNAMSTNTCSNATNGVVEIQRKIIDGTDTGQAIVVTGPPVFAGVAASGNISLTSTATATDLPRVDDITANAVSLLTAAQKTTLAAGFANGTNVTANAATLAGMIAANSATSGYTATSASNTVIVTKTSVGTAANGLPLALASTGVKATATITVGTTGQTAGTPAELGTSVTGSRGIAAGATTVVGDLTTTQITSGTATATNATTIKNNMTNGFTATCTGGGTCTGSVLTVTAPAVGSALNGTAFTFVAGAAVAPTAAVTQVFPVGFITFGGTATSNTTAARINRDLASSRTITVGTGGGLIVVSTANPLTISASLNRTPAQVASAVVASVGTGGTVKAYIGGTATSANVPASCTSKTTSVVCLVDTTGTITNGKAVAVGTTSNFGTVTTATTATANGVVAVAATLGVTDFALALSGTTFSGGRAIQPATGSNLAGGQASHPGTINTTTTSMSSGSTSTVPVRAGVGVFKRTDIVPNGGANVYKSGVNVASGVMTYPKTLGRTDCVTTAGICTYAEELQNFANWYSYYKNRILMMKSTSTISFGKLTGANYNVGFDNISNCDGKACSTSVVQPVGQFVDTCTVACSSTGTCGGTGKCQRSKWWSNLTSVSPSSATPLRASIAKIGRYFAGKLTTDPIEYSCQQNFNFLVTDGYWNEGEAYSGSSSNILTVNGTDIGNTDNVAVNASGSTNRPFYDGQMASTACPAINTTTRSAVSSCRNLSDIAYYYYTTDLRSATFSNEQNATTHLDVSENNVFKAGSDDFTSQHVTFFAMALGIDGQLQYREDYAEANTGDYFNIQDGTKDWPAVKNLDPTGIDDLWHAAVNGRGKYFSARDPAEVSAGLSDALTSITRRVGAASAAATSNLQPIAGDNFAYVANYTTVDWSGDLQARLISTTTGAVSVPLNASPNECISDSGCPWSAQKELDTKAWATRKIYMAPPSGTTLRAFTYSNLSTTEKAFFNPASGNATYGTTPLSQYALLSATYPTDITDAKMVDYLRGDRSLETGNGFSNPEIWRKRFAVLGDIVNTQPTFVKKTISTTYEDTGYAAFVTAHTGREGVVYVSSNDGMLHAFASDDFLDASAIGGEELWAYIPTQGLPYLRNLADTSYVHRFYVDGPITVSDVNFGGGSSDWHTVLVGGLGAGGKGYYALDITDPVNPKFLWEFTDPNLGLTYGNPSMNKLPNGEWVVLFTSGYNNVPPTPPNAYYAGADGKGYLYAVDVKTGALKSGFPMTNNSGTAASPSNLGKLAAWVDNLVINNTVTDVYAGDMDGNLWRFDLSDNSVSRLAHLTDAATPTPNAQPITTRPELTRVDGNRVIYVGTGRYLGITDLSDTSVQSFYAIKDTDTSPSPDWDTPRTETGTIGGASGQPMFVHRKLISTKEDGSKITRTSSSGSTVDARQICTGVSSTVDSASSKCNNESGEVVDWAQHGGWYFDMPDPGERINVDLNLTLGTLTIPSNVPASSACTSGGYGWVNYVDFKTGLDIDNSTMIVSEKIANALIVGLNVIKVGDRLVAIITTSDDKHEEAEPPGTPGKFKGKRDLWRELDLY